jgi:type IV secretory pathway VirB2 component (pilin)
MHLIGPASASASLADPPATSVVVAAVAWLEGTLLGPVATTVAIIAVASIGLMMLAGRLDVRRGLTVIAGSFVLFGASMIASGLQSSLPEGGQEVVSYEPERPPQPAAAPTPPPPIANDDPYAGASVARP